jgi:hypothetical protein
MLDSVGYAYVPLYWIFGRMAIIVMMVLLAIGFVRIFTTVMFRAVILAKTRGCGPWILGAVYGGLFQLLITPFSWVDRVAAEIADRIDKDIQERAERGIYPSGRIAEMMRQEGNDNPWRRAIWGPRDPTPASTAPEAVPMEADKGESST